MSADDLVFADHRRFVWWFSDHEKSSPMLEDFYRGVRDGWSLDQWRAHCDKWMDPAPMITGRG